MKKFVAIALVVCMLLSTCVVYAADFDPSKYTVEELEDIQRIIAKYLPKTLGNQVLYDENGLYIECRGIYTYSKSSYIVDLYIDNLLGEDIYVSLRNGRANRFTISFSNNGNTIKNDSIYLASANFDYIIDTDELKKYGVTNLDRVDFDLIVKTGGMFGDIIVELPIRIDVDIPV